MDPHSLSLLDPDLHTICGCGTDPGGKHLGKNRKKARKLVIIGILLPFIFNVNLDQLHGFYTFELFGCLFQLQKTFFLSFSNCLLFFFYKICTYCLLIIHMGSKKKSYCRRAAMFSYLDSPSFLLGGLRPLGKLFIRYFHKFVEAGSGSALKKQLDPDTH